VPPLNETRHENNTAEANKTDKKFNRGRASGASFLEGWVFHGSLNNAKSCFIILSMRSTRTLSVTLPPEMLKRAQSIAKQESRTMSELVREALRHYDRRAWWDEVNAYGRHRAEERGLREGDVDRLIHESRRVASKRKQRTPTLKKLAAQITPGNRYYEVAAGPERGKEKPAVKRSVKFSKS
jgi:CopG family transcriptional regulator / antitoxin EndoAI